MNDRTTGEDREPRQRDPALQLYVREDCHLCTEMAAELSAFAQSRPLEVTVHDIDDDARLRAAYDHKVPVLTAGDYEICHYFLDLDALIATLDGTLKGTPSP